MNRSARIILGVLVLSAVVFLFYPKSTNHSSPPPQAKQTAAPLMVQESAAPAKRPGDRAAGSAGSASAPTPQKTRATSQQQSTPTSGGLVAVIDPATGQLREADATDIGGLVAPQPLLQRRTLTLAAPVTPEVTTFDGPGGSTGAVLGDDQMAFMVVTKTLDGKLTTDCVDGKKAADAKVRAGNHGKKKAAAQAKVQPAQKETNDEM